MRFTPAIVTSLAVGLAVALAAGCVGNIDNTEPQGGVDGGVTTAQGRTLYKQNVHPVMNRCTGTACHSVGGTGGGQSKFADASGDISYDAIVKAPLIVGTFTSTAGVLTKIAGGHNGITYSAPEISSITAWLAKESTERNGTTNTDRTNYFETVPSNQLELVLWLESDRMAFLLDHVDLEAFAREIGALAPFEYLEAA